MALYTAPATKLVPHSSSQLTTCIVLYIEAFSPPKVPASPSRQLQLGIASDMLRLFGHTVSMSKTERFSKHSFKAISLIYEGAGTWPSAHPTVQRHLDNEAMYGTDPFSAQNATNDGSTYAPSVFGALPYPGSVSSVGPPLQTLVTLRFTSLNPTVLDCKVLGPNNETCYRVASDLAGRGCSLLKNGAGHNVALVEWRSHPTIEAQAVGAKQTVGQWLRLASDRRYARSGCGKFVN